jgi:hypothetical protein
MIFGIADLIDLLDDEYMRVLITARKSHQLPSSNKGATG